MTKEELLKKYKGKRNEVIPCITELKDNIEKFLKMEIDFPLSDEIKEKLATLSEEQEYETRVELSILYTAITYNTIYNEIIEDLKDLS